MFTEADIRSLFRTIAAYASNPPQIPQPSPCQELVAGGLVLDRHVKEKLRMSILSEDPPTDGRTSLLELASLTGIELRKVESLLPLESEEWGRVGHSTVVRKSEFIRLQKDLEELLGKTAVQLSSFCREKDIDSDLFFKLLRACGSANEFQFFGTDGDEKLVYRHSLQEQLSDELVTLLQDSKRPLAISEVLQGRRLPLEFIQHLIRFNLRDGQLKGYLKGSIFISNVCRELKQKEALDTLVKNEIIGLELFDEYGAGFVDDLPAEYLPSTIRLDMHIITETYLARMISETNSRLQAEGWAQVQDRHGRLTANDEVILRKELIRKIDIAEEHASYFISKGLKQTLLNEALEYASNQAESYLMAPSRYASLKFQSLQKQLALKSSLPMMALSSLLKEIAPIASQAFSDHVRSLQDASASNATKALADKCFSRFKVHHMALNSIVDNPLRLKLAGDLLEYSRDQALSHLDKLDSIFTQNSATTQLHYVHSLRSALQLLPADPEEALQELDSVMSDFIENIGIQRPSEADLEKKKIEMMNDILAQLQRAKDPSLMMTLALVSLHGRLGRGVLRASGKYVPKLLKLLKPQLSQDDYDFLVSLKDRVVAKSAIPDNDLQRLRDQALLSA